MAYANLRLQIHGRIATLTISRPEVRNALDGPTVEEFHQALAQVSADRAAS